MSSNIPPHLNPNPEEAEEFGYVRPGTKEYHCYDCDAICLNVSGFVTQVCGQCGSNNFEIGDVGAFDELKLKKMRRRLREEGQT